MKNSNSCCFFYIFKNKFKLTLLVYSFSKLAKKKNATGMQATKTLFITVEKEIHFFTVVDKTKKVSFDTQY